MGGGTSRVLRNRLSIYSCISYTHVLSCSGGSRGRSYGAMDPPFQAEHCMQKQDSQQLTAVQQSLQASTPVLSVQSSCKQTLENLNLQAWFMQQVASQQPASPSAPHKKWAWLKFYAHFARIFVCVDLQVLDPPLSCIVNQD